jgi:hypothetical protein
MEHERMLLMILLGFLALIGGILMRWSADTSAKTERSVFSPSLPADPVQ